MRVVLSAAISVGAIEVNEVFVGLGDVDENAGQELEGVGQGIVVELVTGFGLIDEQSGVASNLSRERLTGARLS